MRRGRFDLGLPANELWGVATCDRGKRERKRGEAARARRRAKKKAKVMGLTLKAWLRRLAREAP